MAIHDALTAPQGRRGHRADRVHQPPGQQLRRPRGEPAPERRLWTALGVVATATCGSSSRRTPARRAAHERHPDPLRRPPGDPLRLGHEHRLQGRPSRRPQGLQETDGAASSRRRWREIQKELSRLMEHAIVSGAEPSDVAGQPAYTVRIEPKQNGGLVGGAELAWDAVHGTPLRAAVYAKGDSSPVLELKVTDISFGPVSSSVFDVTPPAGAKVTDLTPQSGTSGRSKAGQREHGSGDRPAGRCRRRSPSRSRRPDSLAGLSRNEVRLIQSGDQPAALVTYGTGTRRHRGHRASGGLEGRAPMRAAINGQVSAAHGLDQRSPGPGARYAARHPDRLRAKRRRLHRDRLRGPGDGPGGGAGPLVDGGRPADRDPRAGQALRGDRGRRRRRPHRQSRATCSDTWGRTGRARPPRCG